MFTVHTKKVNMAQYNICFWVNFNWNWAR